MAWRGSLPLDSTFQPEGDAERYIGQPVQLTMWWLAAVLKQMMARHPAGSILLSLMVVYVMRFISRYFHCKMNDLMTWFLHAVCQLTVNNIWAYGRIPKLATKSGHVVYRTVFSNIDPLIGSGENAEQCGTERQKCRNSPGNSLGSVQCGCTRHSHSEHPAFTEFQHSETDTEVPIQNFFRVKMQSDVDCRAAGD